MEQGASVSPLLGAAIALPWCPRPVRSWAPRPDRSSRLVPCQAALSFWPCQNPSFELRLGICSVSLCVISLMRSMNCHCASVGGWAGARGGSEGLWVLSPPHFQPWQAASWLRVELLPSNPHVCRLVAAPQIPFCAEGPAVGWECAGTGAAPLGVGGEPWGSGLAGPLRCS